MSWASRTGQLAQALWKRISKGRGMIARSQQAATRHQYWSSLTCVAHLSRSSIEARRRAWIPAKRLHLCPLWIISRPPQLATCVKKTKFRWRVQISTIFASSRIQNWRVRCVTSTACMSKWCALRIDASRITVATSIVWSRRHLVTSLIRQSMFKVRLSRLTCRTPCMSSTALWVLTARCRCSTLRTAILALLV